MTTLDLQDAVERRCACAVRFVQTVPVSAPFGCESWDVVVHVFDLEGCEKTNRAYAWSSGSVYTALDIGPIRSPSNAVNAISRSGGADSRWSPPRTAPKKMTRRAPISWDTSDADGTRVLRHLSQNPTTPSAQ
jgi:hypothetical protein